MDMLYPVATCYEKNRSEYDGSVVFQMHSLFPVGICYGCINLGLGLRFNSLSVHILICSIAQCLFVHSIFRRAESG
jgi:hypothetical protein